MLGMYGPCLRRHPHFENVRCVDVAGHSGAHMAHTPGGAELSWSDEDDGLRALAAREAGADLDATKDHLAALRARGDLAGALTATTAELHQLIKEVEYLRKERAAVVAWLRQRHADTQDSDGFSDLYDNAVSCTYRRAADAIERGEHRREGGQ